MDPRIRRGACSRSYATSIFRNLSAFLGAGATSVLGKRIAPKFRELHGLRIDLEEGRILTPDLKDHLELWRTASQRNRGSRLRAKGNVWHSHQRMRRGCHQRFIHQSNSASLGNLCEAATHCRAGRPRQRRHGRVYRSQHSTARSPCSGAPARISPLLWWARRDLREMRFKSGPTSMLFSPAAPACSMAVPASLTRLR